MVVEGSKNKLLIPAGDFCVNLGICISQETLSPKSLPIHTGTSSELTGRRVSIS